MLLEEISIVDIILEGLKVAGMSFLLFTLVRASKRYPSLSGSRWNFILYGFVLMLIGFTFDWTDEFINYEATPTLTIAQAFIEEMGLIGGLFLVTVGFSRWLEFISRFLGVKAKI